MKGRLATRGWGLLSLLVLGAVVLSACNIMEARNRPEQMRVIAQPEDLDGPVRMITSRSFVRLRTTAGEDLGLEFLDADTVMVELPMDSTFSMAPTYMLAVRFLAPEEEFDPVPRITMDVRVDGRNSWSGSQAMFPGSYIEYFLRHAL